MSNPRLTKKKKFLARVQNHDDASHTISELMIKTRFSSCRFGLFNMTNLEDLSGQPETFEKKKKTVFSTCIRIFTLVYATIITMLLYTPSLRF